MFNSILVRIFFLKSTTEKIKFIINNDINFLVDLAYFSEIIVKMYAFIQVFKNLIKIGLTYSLNCKLNINKFF